MYSVIRLHLVPIYIQLYYIQAGSVSITAAAVAAAAAAAASAAAAARHLLYI